MRAGPTMQEFIYTFFNYFYRKYQLMNADKNRGIAETWLRAFNTKDLQLLLSLYDPQAVHFSPKLRLREPATGGYIRGHEAMKQWWKDAFTRLPSLTYKPVTITADNDRVFMEYIRSVENEEDLNVAEVLDIQSGKIIASRVYHG